MNNVVGYGCVASSQHSVRDNRFLSEEEVLWRQNTKVAEEIKKLTNLFLPADCVQIDVIGGSYRRRRHLENCLKTMGHGDSIVISSLSSLGLNNEELLENYKKIFEKRIGLLLPDYTMESGLSKYSTTDFAFSPISISEDDFKFLCSEISSEEITTRRGRKSIVLTDEFKNVYWLYERYLIDPITACKNCYFTISKNTFRKLAEEYEKTSEYNSDLKKQEIEFRISGLPKRFGVISQNITNMIVDVAENGISFNDACFVHDTELDEIQFQRYILKYYCPKGKVLQTTFQLRDFELIEALQPIYEPKT